VGLFGRKARETITRLAFGRKASEQNFESVITYANRLRKEFNSLTIASAVRRLPALQQTPAYTKWCIANSDILS